MKALIPLVLVVGCSDYDLHGSNGKPGDPNTDDSGGHTVTQDSSGDGSDDSATVIDTEESNVGTQFMAVTTANALLPKSFQDDFAVVVTNPDESESAHVTVTLAGATVAETDVASKQAVTIPLPMVRELQLAMDTNVLAVASAYEIVSDRPIAAYQFNPLHYTAGAGQYSYTNDASVLLPEHVFGTEYMIGSWPTLSNAYPGFAAIVATEDGTQVTIKSRTKTASGVISPLSPGDEATVTLDRGDVFQLFAATSSGADLTGSVIESTAPVGVFGGHQCTNVPLTDPSCDHLEEMLAPTTSWGDEFVMTALNHPDKPIAADAVYRVVALSDGTSVSFEPAVTGSTTLDRGEYAEFTTNEDFVVTGSQHIAVFQYMESCEAIGTAYTTANGDPSMGSGIPQNQARSSYVFLVPDTYETNWVNVVAEMGTKVLLDGGYVSFAGQIGSSGYQSGRMEVSAGQHVLESEDGTPITVTVYGYADYTSYLYPGGMNVIAE